MEKKIEWNEKIEKLIEVVKQQFHRILRSNPKKWKLSKEEILRWEASKSMIRKSLKECGYGDEVAKVFIQNYIMEFIQKYGEISPITIDSMFPFQNPSEIELRTKFLILLSLKEQEVGKEALEHLIECYHWNQSKYQGDDSVYEVSMQDVERAFYQEYRPLSYEEKLKILVQRIYESYLGYGMIDQLLWMNLDGVSGGVSKNEKTIWIFYHGITIHFSFLTFEEDREFIRVCKNLYRYESIGQLSQSRGYITGTRKDGSRVVVMRPPFSETWVFFVRKFDMAKQLELEGILKWDTNRDIYRMLKWIVKGCQVMGVTGNQGSGKTTLLMALIQFIPFAYTIRVQELTFELQLRERYPDRNILSLRETARISGQEALDLLKKTDGMVTILGEVATHEVASWLIQVAQTASLFTMFTHHAKTTKTLVEGLRNALLKEGGFQNETIALEQVVSSIRFDVHMEKTREGERYIERITEIIPNYQQEGVLSRDLIVWEKGSYVIKNQMSKETKYAILRHLTAKEKQQFLEEMGARYGD